MIFIISYNALDTKAHAFIIEVNDNATSEEEVIEVVKGHLQRMYANNVDELIELEAIENYDTIICDTLNAIDYRMPEQLKHECMDNDHEKCTARAARAK